jgi:hypothetical protein
MAFQCRQFTNLVRFQSFIFANMKMTAVWDIALCNLLQVADMSEVLTTSIIRVVMWLIALMVEAVSIYEVAVSTSNMVQYHRTVSSSTYRLFLLTFCCAQLYFLKFTIMLRTHCMCTPLTLFHNKCDRNILNCMFLLHKLQNVDMN